MVWSQPPLAKRVPSRLKAKQVGRAVWPRRISTLCPASTSQSLTWQSASTVARRRCCRCRWTAIRGCLDQREPIRLPTRGNVKPGDRRREGQRSPSVGPRLSGRRGPRDAPRAATDGPFPWLGPPTARPGPPDAETHERTPSPCPRTPPAQSPAAPRSAPGPPARHLACLLEPGDHPVTLRVSVCSLPSQRCRVSR